MATVNVQKFLSLVPDLLSFPFENIWSSYDKEADVLYLSFKKPAHADRTDMTDDNILIRYAGKNVIGLTIMNASKRLSAN